MSLSYPYNKADPIQKSNMIYNGKSNPRSLLDILLDNNNYVNFDYYDDYFTIYDNYNALNAYNSKSGAALNPSYLMTANTLQNIQMAAPDALRLPRQMPVRHQDPDWRRQIWVGGPPPSQVGACPPIPPRPAVPPALCRATQCRTTSLCRPGRICCFNGCTYACVPPVRPAQAFDWIEDKSAYSPIGSDITNPSLPKKFESEPKNYYQGAGQSVQLPGGCQLSQDKYDQLKKFQDSKSIEDCLCIDGEVVCKVQSTPQT